MSDTFAARLRSARRRLSAWLPALCLGLAAGPVHAAVPPGSWCVVGTGNSGGADGWIDVVEPTAATAVAVTLSQTLADPSDCAVDPTTGDIIVVDQGNAGPPAAASDGGVYRVVYDPSTQQGTVIPLVAPGVPAPAVWDGTLQGPDTPLVNPRGVAVGPDGTVYVADAGRNANANDNDGAIYALTFSGGAVDTLYRRAVGNAVDSPVDVDLDPRPWNDGGGDVLFLVFVEYGGRLRRVESAPTASQTVTNIGGDPGGTGWSGIEVGAYGNYWITRASTPTLERYERRTGTRTGIATAGGGLPFQGLSIDHISGDVALVAGGLVYEVPANIGPAPQPGARYVYTPARTGATGIGFSSPLPTGGPSANLAMPTRFAPVPSGGIVLGGPGLSSAQGEPETELNVFVEVTGDTLLARFFDIDSEGAYDAARDSGDFDSPVEVTLYAPDNTTVLAQETIPAGGRVDLDQRVATLTCASPPCVGPVLTVRGTGVDVSGTGPGLYRLQVRLTGGDDMNGFGLWVQDYQAYTYYVPVGPLTTLAGVPSQWPLDGFRTYPHFERGCEYVLSEFDSDNNATYEVRTRLDRVLPIAGSSGNDAHAETLIDPVVPRTSAWTLPGTECAGTNCAIDYGIQTLSAAIVPSATVNNIIGVRAADFNGYEDAGGSSHPVPVPRGEAAPPSAPPPDTPAFRTSPLGYNQEATFGSGGGNNFLRFFLPRYEERPNPLDPLDPTGAARPYAPYLMQSATQLTASTPPTPPPAPQAGTTTPFLMNVTVVNPDPVNAMDDVDLTVPIADLAGSGVAYTTSVGTGVSCDFGVPGCNVPASGPNALTTPLTGGPPTVITLRFTEIPPASSATLSYALDVTPPSAGATVHLTEGPRYRNTGALPTLSGTTATFPANPAPPVAAPLSTDMGTRAVYTAAWGRDESLGPLCDVYLVENTVVPNAVDLASFDAHPHAGAVLLTWETAAEYDNLGFRVYRRLEGEQDFALLNEHLILGRGTTDLSGRYALLDVTVPNGVRAEYVLEDVETDGSTSQHGPVSATPRADAEPVDLDPDAFHVVRVVLPDGEAWGSDVPGETAGDDGADAGPASPDPGLFRVVSRDARSAVVEVIVPEVELDPLDRDGARWTRVRAAGYEAGTSPGQPELPQRTYWLQGLDTTDVTLEVLEDDATETVLADPVLPVGGTPDAVAYASAAPLPAAAPVELAGSVRLAEGQRLIALRVEPARFAGASNTLSVSRHLRIRVVQGGPVPEPDGSAEALAANRAAVAAQPGVKLGVVGPGIARMTGAELVAAGLDPGVDPRHLHVFRNGVEVAVRLRGEADGVLDADDELLLFAPAVDDLYGDQAVFFAVDGDTPGRRLDVVDAAPDGGPELESLPAHARLEPQETYLPTVRNGEGDNFVGPYVFSSPVTLEVPTPGAMGGAATLYARLRGGTSFDAPEPDHHFEVRAAGSAVIDAWFDGTDLFEAVADLPENAVTGATLAVEVAPRFDAAMPFLDLAYVDAFEVDYHRAPRLEGADAGRLVFETDRGGVLELGGVDASAEVWDVTDPSAPVAQRGEPAPGARRLAVSAGRRYAVALPEGLLSPAWARANTPSDWTTGDHGAEWLAIAESSLVASAQRLADHREDEGLSAAVVDVEDVYDEAAGGVPGPRAVQEFLRRIAQRWDPAPRYAVFVGDATYDHRDYLGGTARDGVPTLRVDTAFVEAASDSALVSFDDDPAPELAFGRLPARTPAELDAMVDKIIAYESLPPGEADWERRLLLVSDDGAGAGDAAEAAEFEGILADFRGGLPPELAETELRMRDVPEGPDQGAATFAAIENALEGGVAAVLYSGHGGARVWADERILAAEDVPRIAVGARQPLIVALDCLNGFFDAPNEESLSELALREPASGAIAYVSSTAVSALPGQRAFARALGARLARADTARIGDAVRAAELAIAGEPGADDVMRSWVLMGDPALRLALPPVPVADAGPDTTTRVDRPRRLDGRGSRSASGAALAYAWTLAPGTPPDAATLVGADTATPIVVVHAEGAVELELRVHETGPGAVSSAPDRVVVTAEPAALSCGTAVPDGSARLSGLDAVYLLLPLLGRRFRRRRPRSAARRPDAR